jgi:hypothetical protein
MNYSIWGSIRIELSPDRWCFLWRGAGILGGIQGDKASGLQYANPVTIIRGVSTYGTGFIGLHRTV